MLISISKKCLIELVIRQLNSFFGFDKEKEWDDLTNSIEKSLEKIEYCFSFRRNKYYRKDNSLYFNPFQSDQYTIFLYYVSNILSYKCNNKQLADKVYYLNKALNNVDLYHEIQLPDIFGAGHPLGCVIGRAKYADFFYFSQHCTVGNNRDIYPEIGRNVTMFLGASIIGKSQIGNNCMISANTYIKDQDVPDNSLVFGSSPNLIIKHKDESYFWKNNMFNSEPMP
jgi:serine O-acetyltransferase